MSNFKGGASWQARPTIDVERMCRYVTDDGAVASYFHIPRHEVMEIRANMRTIEIKPHPTLRAKVNDAINASSKLSEAKAQEASAMLLERCNMMFRRCAQRDGLSFDEAKVAQLYGRDILDQIKAQAA